MLSWLSHIDVAVLAVLLIFGTPLVAVVGGLALGALKILRGGGSHRSAEQEAEETRLIQSLHQGLRKMEGRIEALETILLDKERKETK